MIVTYWTYRSRYWTTDSLVLNIGSSPCLLLLHSDIRRASTALEEVKYSTEWLRNLVFFFWTLAIIHFAIWYSSLEGFSTGVITSTSSFFLSFDTFLFSILVDISECAPPTIPVVFQCEWRGQILLTDDTGAYTTAPFWQLYEAQAGKDGKLENAFASPWGNSVLLRMFEKRNRW